MATKKKAAQWKREPSGVLTMGDLTKLLVEAAEVHIAGDTVMSLLRNRHMNDLTDRDARKLMEAPSHYRRVAEAAVASFINHFVARRGGDLGLYVRHLREKR